jgi:hypothetical protein
VPALNLEDRRNSFHVTSVNKQNRDEDILGLQAIPDRKKC